MSDKLRSVRRDEYPLSMKPNRLKKSSKINLPKSQDVQNIILDNLPRFLVTSRYLDFYGEEKKFLIIYDVITKKTLLLQMRNPSQTELEFIERQLSSRGIDEETEAFLAHRYDYIEATMDDNILNVESIIYAPHFLKEKGERLVGNSKDIPVEKTSVSFLTQNSPIVNEVSIKLDDMAIMFLRDAFLGHAFNLPADNQFDLSISDGLIKKIKEYFGIFGNNW